MKPGQRVIAFDKISWILEGRSKDDKERFWRPAIILQINEAHHDVPETATIRWEYSGPKHTSHGHRLEELRVEAAYASE